MGASLAVVIGLVPLLWVGARAAAADSIGVSPAELSVDGAIRGQVYQRSIQIAADAVAGGAVTPGAGGQVASWLSFFDLHDPTGPPVDRLVVPPGVTDDYIGVRLAVPPTAANGVYTGTITLYASTVTDASASGPVDLGARVGVTVTVTGSEVIAGQLVAALSAGAAEVGTPLPISARVRDSGNVVLAPTVSIVIRAGTTTVGTVRVPSEQIRPGDTGDLRGVWDTSGVPVGAYTALVTVTDGLVTLGRAEVALRLVPPGTLRRAGDLQSLRLASATVAGGAAEVVAAFTNAGQLDAQAQFRGELWRAAEDLGPVSSPPVLLAPGQTGQLTAVVQTPSAGPYRVTGAVTFAGVRSAARVLTFHVGTDRGLPGVVLMMAVGLSALGLMGLAIVVPRHRQRRA